VTLQWPRRMKAARAVDAIVLVAGTLIGRTLRADMMAWRLCPPIGVATLVAAFAFCSAGVTTFPEGYPTLWSGRIAACMLQ
jgi:hypothetical protein